MIEYRLIEQSDARVFQNKLNAMTKIGWVLWTPPFARQRWIDKGDSLIAILRKDIYDKEETEV